MTTRRGAAPRDGPRRTNRPRGGAYRRNGESLGTRFVDRKNASTGSTDMGNVSQAVPSIHPTFGVGQMIFNHTPEFVAAAITDAAHEATLPPTEALAMTGIDLAPAADLLRLVQAHSAR